MQGGAEVFGAHSHALQFSSELFGFGLSTVIAEGDVIALPGQADGDAPADAPARPGDQGGFSFAVLCHM
jgi:hypothetical protein